MRWLSRWFASRRAPAKPPVPRQAAAAPAPGVIAPSAAPFLPWLLDCGPLGTGPMAVDEERALVVLDRTLAAGTVPPDLLPRAASLVPQLLAMLRQTDLPVGALAHRMAKDVVLAAEVLRLASSPYYRAQGAVQDLRHAITLIGEQGLQSVIARMLLKPLFEASPGVLGARAAARLWEHAERLAPQVADKAVEGGLPAFDGYLVGLLQGSGWTIALRVLDRSGIAPALPPSARFEAALAARAYRLFGQAARGWNITPGFAACAADAAENSLGCSRQPLVVALREAQARLLADRQPATAAP